MNKFLIIIFFSMSIMASHGSALLLGEKRIDLNLNGFELSESKTAKNRKIYYAAAQIPGTGIKFSITAEYSRQIFDSVLLREQWWSIDKKNPLIKTCVRNYGYDKFAIVEWDADAPDGTYKHINAYRAEGGICINAHLSCVNSQLAAGQLLAMLDLIKISDSTPDEMLECGMALYRGKSYPEAIECLRKWMQSGQRGNLKDSKRRMAIAALGIAYGASGRLKDAQKALEEALLKDPEYPLFHYNLAGACAGQRDFPKALAHLKLTLKYLDNLEIYMQLPNPANDLLFKELADNPEFKALCKGWPQ
jgi:tetratricopeptide (TPR) repeat protein